MNRPRYTLAVAVVVVLLVSSAVGGGQNTPTSGEPRVNENATNGSATVQNVTAPRHRDPDVVRRKGNSAAVERWLQQRLASRFGNSMVRIERGQYEKARGLVGDDFSEQLSQYVEVQQSTEGGGNQSAEFQNGMESQREFIGAVREYHRTYRRYQKARRNGNIERARRLARKLDRLAEQTNQSGTSLQSTYRNISQTTPANLNESTQQVTSISQNVTRTQSSVEEEVFEGTTVNVTANKSAVSFLDPIELNGVLTTENGSALSNRNITLNIGNQTVETRTDDEGYFQATYRPTELPVNTNRLTVEYRPKNESAYLGSTDAVAVNVTQVDSSLTVRKAPKTAKFGDQIVVTGVVGAKDVGAGNVPVVVSIGDREIGRSTTNRNGSFTVRTRLPHSVRAGTRPLRVSVPLSKRALSGATVTRELRVNRTNTSLSMHAARNGSSVAVRGQLDTKDDKGVTNGTVVFRVDGTRVGEAKTGKNGSYAGKFDLPPSVDRDESATMVAVYDPSPSNLGIARDNATLQAVSDGSRLPEWISLPWAGVALLTVVFLLGTVLVRSRREDETDDDGEEFGPSAAPLDGETEATDEDGPAETRDPTSEELDALDAARNHLSSGDGERAVETGYSAFRRFLRRRYELEPSATPRELRDSAGALLSEREYRTLDGLTNSYERVVFASDVVSTESVSNLLDAAEGILIEEDGDGRD